MTYAITFIMGTIFGIMLICVVSLRRRDDE